MGQKRGGAGLAALCLWCGGGRVRGLGPAQGAEALLFAAGMGAQAAPPGASPSPTATPGGAGYPLPDDGVVSLAAAREPQASVTPDPGRGYAPVEEIRCPGGAPGGRFLRKGHHRLRHGFERRPPGGALRST